MNIRFPSALETVQGTSKTGVPARTGMSGSTRLVIGIVAVLVLAFIAWKIFGSLLPPTPTRPPPPVVVQTIARQDITVGEHTIGTVVANAPVLVNARVQGQFLKANFKEGDVVKTGQLLFQIDPVPYQATYNSAMATLASAKAKAVCYARLQAQKAFVLFFV